MALQTATATFTGAEDTVAVSWTAMAGSYVVLPGNPTITDGSGGVLVWLTSVTSSGATVNISDRFSGSVVVTVLDTP
jgi:hypothetical protein